MQKLQRGRPERQPTEMQRIRLWVQSVCVAAEMTSDSLEGVLGADGVWAGLWSRYSRGLIAPSRERLARIDSVFPGTERYYSCPLWTLAEEREFTGSELRDMGVWFCKLFRDGLVGDLRTASAWGKFWADAYHPMELADKASMLIDHRRFGLDALATILFLIREAEMRQDISLYLFCMKMFARAERDKASHPILRELPSRFFGKIIEPLRTLKFSNRRFDSIFTVIVGDYCLENKLKRETCDLLELMRSIPDWPMLMGY